MISVITPVYNNRAYIEGCLENVCSELVDGIEHVVVDGGSSDGTVAVIKEFAQKYSHIRWISETDTGQSDAMNKGIRMAQADTIGFLNVDDYYQPGTLKLVCNRLQNERHPFFLLGHCQIWDNDGKLIKIHRAHSLSLSRIIGKRDFPPNPSAYFYSRSLHTELGYYNVSDHISMDVDFLLKLAHSDIRCICINEILGNFRLLQGTKTYEGMQSESIYRATNALINSYSQKLSLRGKLSVAVNRFFTKLKRGLTYLVKPGKILRRLRS